MSFTAARHPELYLRQLEETQLWELPQNPSSVFLQRAWLLRCIAIELHLSKQWQVSWTSFTHDTLRKLGMMGPSGHVEPLLDVRRVWGICVCV